MFVHPIIKVPGLLLVAAGVHVAATPPHPSSDGNNTIDPPPSDRFMRVLLRIGSLGYLKICVWSLTLAESAVILANTFPSHPVSRAIIRNLMWGAAGGGQVRFTPASALGIALGIGCGRVRYACFRELGKRFTFGMTIQKDHELVTTGPYSIVRHPSYTGMLMFAASATLLTATKGSWARESGLLSRLSGQMVVASFALLTGAMNVIVLFRIRDEERELRKRFGEQWDRWAEKATMTSSITKRLHISGLTPTLNATDISQRLSSFGTVKAVDGFGLLDGVGNPRKYGYVTMETTPEKLARCCSLLSGTTWKGAKLRIGEAKPDFRERITAESAAAKREAEAHEDDRRARKKQRIQKYGAVHADDMSLVTKENAHVRQGWVVTPLGRIVRPVKMKPPRPLATMDASVGKADGRKKKKTAMVGLRAKRKTIDMLKYGSVHLKGFFMDVIVPDTVFTGNIGQSQDSPLASESTVEEHLSEEGNQSDEEMSDSGHEETEDDVEDIRSASHEPHEDLDNEQSNKKSVPTSLNRLKELFAPREEDAGFSLLGHLNLDLELDEDVPFPITNEEQQIFSQVPQAVETLPILTGSRGEARTRTTPSVQLDPKTPLFFPLRLSSTSGTTNKGRRLRDLFDVAKENRWNWRDPSVGFYRTETEDAIRKRWEESKVELTREWKRRSKEAGKMNRRRYKGVGVDSE
ncbi:hypothetical protein APHAL10511_004659 [Amanita phalloides]|nr:hypothetical protein APHAL10511_004659 [Amanita phalloides]